MTAILNELLSRLLRYSIIFEDS